MTNTLSFGVGFDGGIPRSERKDLPDCSGAMTEYITSIVREMRYTCIEGRTVFWQYLMLTVHASWHHQALIAEVRFPLARLVNYLLRF